MFSSFKKVCAVVVVSLFLLQGGALASSNWSRTQEGFKVWVGFYHAAETATASTWSGAVDADGYASGKGVLKFFEGKEVTLIYEGILLKGKATGKGSYRDSFGCGYEGDFVDGKRHGKGVVKLSGGKRYYEGDFVDGLFNGKGVVYNFDGSIYKGDFVGGKEHGKGILTLPDGTRYEGLFKDGAFIG